MIEESQITFAHGSPSDPIWGIHYYLTQCRRNFCLPNSNLLVGHSHVPLIFGENRRTTNNAAKTPIAGARNSGLSFNRARWVGHDRNPKAAYVIWT